MPKLHIYPPWRTSPPLHIGTAGWSYKDWVGPFYSQTQSKDYDWSAYGKFNHQKQTGMPSADWLKFYSQYFNCVEVNSTYYAYTSLSTVRGWVRKTENVEDFLFTVKLHKDFTHLRKFNNQSIKIVQDNLDILAKAERLGGILIQFPYSFSFNNSTAEYVQNLNKTFKQYTQFVEMRHSSWNNKTAHEFFKSLNVTFCTIDQPQTCPPIKIICGRRVGQSIPFEPIVTNDKAYIRFHGRNVDAWKKSIANFGKEQSYEQASERYKYLYSPGELIEIS
ncbi:MAG: DUF72 domain-containing protein, partial [Bacteroidetes bacterium]|nr:DUF72 domain-containing protein [Bacteroidota bacterium]